MFTLSSTSWLCSVLTNEFVYFRRVYKSELEIEVIKYVVEVSSAAHRHVMRLAKAGLYEYQCESEFLNYCYKNGGCRHSAYTCICGSGINSAVLHYGHAGCPNNYQLKEGMLW